MVAPSLKTLLVPQASWTVSVQTEVYSGPVQVVVWRCLVPVPKCVVTGVATTVTDASVELSSDELSSSEAEEASVAEATAGVTTAG